MSLSRRSRLASPQARSYSRPVQARPVRTLRELVDPLPSDAAESLPDLGRAHQNLDM